jgi:hypothetical protein
MQVACALVLLRMGHTTCGRPARSLHPYEYFIGKCVTEHQHFILLPSATQQTNICLIVCMCITCFYFTELTYWRRLCFVEDKWLFYDLTVGTEDSFLLSESPIVRKSTESRGYICLTVHLCTHLYMYPFIYLLISYKMNVKAWVCYVGNERWNDKNWNRLLNRAHRSSNKPTDL